MSETVDAEAIEAWFLATVLDPANGYKVSGCQTIADRDAPRLLRMSSRKARELRESGEGWPRYAVPIDGCRYSVFIKELAEWYVERPREAS